MNLIFILLLDNNIELIDMKVYNKNKHTEIYLNIFYCNINKLSKIHRGD